MRKKTLKHFIFLIISLLISHTVMAYLIGVGQTIETITQSPLNNPSGFIGLVVFTAIFYWVFAYFREQACVVVCPYGRLQGVLLVKESIVVIYDWLRGEPRNKIKKDQIEGGAGDCIDCNLCVHACPTGIDIRNGTQLECVNCTACIDACDEVMNKIDKPEGLIRYSSHTAIETNQSKLLTFRTMAYSIVLLVLFSLLSFMIVSRSDVETTIMKVRGTLYQTVDDGQITNLFNLHIVNKTYDEKDLEIRILDNDYASIRKIGGSDISVKPSSLYEGVFIISIPADKIENSSTKLTVGIFENGILIEKTKTKFLGPVKR